MRECIVDSSSVSALHLLMGVGDPSVVYGYLGAQWPNLQRVCAGSGCFPSCLQSGTGVSTVKSVTVDFSAEIKTNFPSGRCILLSDNS